MALITNSLIIESQGNSTSTENISVISNPIGSTLFANTVVYYKANNTLLVNGITKQITQRIASFLDMIAAST